MSYILLPLNIGDGTGGQLIADQFTQGSDTATVVYSGLAFGTLGGGSYQGVDSSHGFPVSIVAGSVAQSGSWTVALGAGAALVGQFQLSDGTNVLGTSSHPVIVSVNGNVTLAGTSAVSIADGSDATFGAQADAAAAADTSTASFISLFKRNLEHLTSLIDQLPAALTGSGNLKISIEEAVSTVTVSVSGTTAISGTVTANIGTTNGLALDATLTGGSAKAIARGGQKGTTNANADITHTASGSNHEALDVAIYDASGNQLGTSGAPLRIDPTGTTTQTVSVSGTVTISGAVVGNVASGASDSGDPVKVGGVYNLSAPTFTDGQRGDLQLDSAGNLLVNLVAGGGSGGTSSSFSSAFPATGTAIGASDGTNMLPLLVDGSGYLKVNVVAGGGSGSNAAASATGSTVPTDADFQGVNVAGTLRGQTGVNPSGSIYAGQIDVASVAGTMLDTNSGSKSAGTVRVVIATDQPTMSNAQPVSAAQSGSWTVTADAGTGTYTDQHSDITADYDTGASSQSMTMFGLALPANGGAVAGGTASNPVVVSVANSGVTVDQGTPAALSSAWTVTVTDGATTMPTGASSATSIHTTIDNASIAVTFSGTHDANLSQVAGTSTSVNEGASDAGTQRVAIGKDDSISTDSQISSAAVLSVAVRSSAGHLMTIEAFNSGTSPVYLRIYDQATAPASSDTPVRRYMIPGGTGAGGFIREYLRGRKFTTGIGYRVTGAAADNDTTALAANQVMVNVDHES